MSVSLRPLLKFPSKKWLVILGMLGGISGLIWLGLNAFSRSQTANQAIATATVTKDVVADKITGENGVIHLDDQRILKAAAPGIIETIFVKPGDTVTKGQRLIQLRDQENRLKLQDLEISLQDIALQIRSKQLDLEQARKQQAIATEEYQLSQQNQLAELRKLEQTQRIAYEQQKIETTRTQQDFDAKTEELAEQKIKLKEDQDLFNQGFIPETELRDRQKTVTKTELELINTQNELHLSQISLQQAKADLDRTLTLIKQGLAEPQKQLKAQRDQLTEAEKNLNNATLELNQILREQRKLEIERAEVLETIRQSTITAPINGVILAVKVKVGDVIEAKTDVLLMGDPQQTLVELQLTPLDASKVKPQQKATVKLIGIEATELTGSVKKISLLAGNEDNTTDSTDSAAKVQATIQLDQTKEKIFPGTPVAVDIILKEKNNVLNVPSEAIFTEEDGEKTSTFVWVKDDNNQAKKQIITVGLEGLFTTEIKTGLQEGDVILIPPPERVLAEGDTVTTE